MHREITAGVFLGERRAGTLTFADEITRFDYTDVEPGHPVLGQAFEDEPGRRRVTRIDVPAWFANLLPEAESPLRQMVAHQYGLSAVRSFPMLLALGGDLSGAVEVRPDVDTSSLVDPPEGWPHDSGSDRPRLAFSPDSLVAADEPVFAIRRFDRADDRRIHVEDLAQVREVAPRYKYDQQLLRRDRSRHSHRVR